MLTCALRAQVKELKMESQSNFYIINTTFNALNAQFPRFFFLHLAFLTYAPRAQVNISLKKNNPTILYTAPQASRPKGKGALIIHGY
jgi:hypothetical protein